jgi:large-conductance mechanosensitive channel
MGEIIIGILVMAVFIFFILKKAKNKPQDEMQRIHENEYWAQKESEKTNIIRDDSSDD